MRDGWDMMRWDSHRAPLEDASRSLVYWAIATPQQTIAIGLNAAFRETRRDQADEIIEYVLTLSESVDVVLGGSEIDRVYFAQLLRRYSPIECYESVQRHP